MKFLIAVFLPASPFIPTSPFINFGDFYQPPRLLHPPVYYFGKKKILSLKESFCKTRKNVFYFTSKALYFLEKIKV